VRRRLQDVPQVPGAAQLPGAPQVQVVPPGPVVLPAQVAPATHRRWPVRDPRPAASSPHCRRLQTRCHDCRRPDSTGQSRPFRRG
jgi:hypothetical protein